MPEAPIQRLITALLQPATTWTIESLAHQTHLTATQVKQALDEITRQGCTFTHTSPTAIQLQRSALTTWADHLEHTLPRNGWPASQPHIEVYQQTASTQDALRRLIHHDPAKATHAIAIANQQEAGRGRRGRPWLARPGDALLISFTWPQTPKDPIEAASIRAALAITDLIDQHPAHTTPTIRWPNDILLSNRKVAGILVEHQQDKQNQTHAIIGIGLNVHGHPNLPDAPHRLDDTSNAPTSLASNGIHIDRLWAATSLLTNYARISRLPQQQLAAQWKQRSSDLGRHIILNVSGRPIEGEVVGLDLNDGLILRDHLGTQHHIPAAHATRSAEPSA
ncbi:biotin--[acetyl-CoA-carboxylase] ligase [Mucisphaera sp.]|uniref:biotin--[acetyl-CoA-carboxylase] ligase n=1 Tax=Mucisphaera sp. TaxID=2913024 RepID=UPI003D1397DC